MSETLKFLEAVQEYYGIEYPKAQFKAILSNVGHPNKPYLLELYKVIINSHSAQYGKLPDLAIIRKIQATMDPPETFVERVAIEAPVPEITEAMAKAQEMKMKGGVANWDEVNRVGSKLKRGNGTKWEAHWYWCMTENNGVWKPMEERDD